LELCKGDGINENILPQPLPGAEEVFFYLIADEYYPAAVFQVQEINETPPGLGNDIAHFLEFRVHRAQIRGIILFPHPHLHAAGVFRADQLDFGNLAAQNFRIGFPEADVTPAGKPLVGDAGAPRPHDADALPHSVRRFFGNAVQPVAHGEQKNDRHRSPDDPEQGQKSAQLLVANVAEKLKQVFEKHGFFRMMRDT